MSKVHDIYISTDLSKVFMGLLGIGATAGLGKSQLYKEKSALLWKVSASFICSDPCV